MDPLTDYEWQVLATIAKNCRPGSPFKERHWTELPMNIPGLRHAVARLRAHGMVKFSQQDRWWWIVKPSGRGYDELKQKR